MPVFVQLFYTASAKAFFDYKKDTKTLNKILTCLQEKGARILDIKASMGLGEGRAGVIYIMVYEASSPIDCS